MNGHAIDVYAGCLDQVGLLEMKSLTNATNGFMVISDSFTTAIFKQSFLRTLGKDENGFLQMGFNGTFDVIVCIRCRVVRSQVYVDNQSASLNRLRKKSKSRELSATSSLSTKSLQVSEKRRLESDRLQPGRSAHSRQSHLWPSTSR